MKNFKLTTSIVAIMILSSCEEVQITYPGNNQDNASVAPMGTIIWDLTNIIVEDGKAKLPENSAPQITIGRLNATDENPDDEFTYVIKSQEIDGVGVNFFTIQKDSDSNVDLVTNSNTIDYEGLSGSKEIIVKITVTDDNIDSKTSDFDVIIGITNVNEAPYWSNLNGNEITNYQPSIIADIEIPFQSTLYWDDKDDDQNPVLTWSNQKPAWLAINPTGTTASLAGTPIDVETGSFLITISDADFEVPVDMNFEVRPNRRPYLQSFLPNHSFRVGCNQIADEILTYAAIDPDNSLSSFAGGNAFDILTVVYDENIGWLTVDIDGNDTKTPSLKLRCVSTPTNDDASNGQQIITFHIADNRGSAFQDTTYELTMSVIENNEPVFSNIESLPETIQADSDINNVTIWTVEWYDSDDDQIDFSIDNKPSWIEYESSSGIVTANPHSASHTGTYELVYLLNESNDGCYSISYTHNLVVE